MEAKVFQKRHKSTIKNEEIGLHQNQKYLMFKDNIKELNIQRPCIIQ